MHPLLNFGANQGLIISEAILHGLLRSIVTKRRIPGFFSSSYCISMVEVPEIRVLVYLEMKPASREYVLKLYVDFLVTIQN
jgi:hypothetical protein